MIKLNEKLEIKEECWCVNPLFTSCSCVKCECSAAQLKAHRHVSFGRHGRDERETIQNTVTERERGEDGRMGGGGGVNLIMSAGFSVPVNQEVKEDNAGMFCSQRRSPKPSQH